MKLTVGQVIGRALKSYDVPYITAIPGHGNWNLIDAFHDEGSDVPIVQPMHEQSAVHIADGHYRATGKPIAVIASIGPGAANTVMGMANALNDSTAMLVVTGSAATHMRGHGVVQELDRGNVPDFVQISSAVTKRNFDMIRADQAPFMLHRAFNAMMTGRPGPVHIEVPLDVQAAQTEIEPQDLAKRIPVGRVRADAVAIEAAITLLLGATRPVIVAGGGVIASEASAELTRLVDRLGIPVVYTWSGKGSLSEEHPMDAGNIGHPGTIMANTLAAQADVVLSLGCRFTDWSTSSWRRGVSFDIPGSKLIQIDIDPREIGKNYPAEVGIVADVRLALEDINAGISSAQAQRAKAHMTHHDELIRLTGQWDEMMKPRRTYNGIPTTMTRTMLELRKVLPRHGVVVVGSGHGQGVVKQSFEIYEPRTHITPGSYSPMGFAHPAAMGVKLAKPDVPVVCIVGDGDFMMSLQELATCVAYNIPVIFLILNNAGYISIRDGQDSLTGRNLISEFKNHRTGKPYSTDFVALAKSFGLEFATKIERVEDIGSTIARAIESNSPALIEVPISRDPSIAPALVVGWWDFPILPSAPQGIAIDYAHGIGTEQHQGRDVSHLPIVKPMGSFG